VRQAIERPNYSNALASLRGLAACVVVVFHALLVFEVAGLDDPHRAALAAEPGWGLVVHGLLALFNGHSAVIVFFVLSGLVLALSLEREADLGPATLAAYYVRRAARLWPLLLVATAGTMVLVLAWFEPGSTPAFTGWADGYYRSAPGTVEIARNAVGLDSSLNPPVWTIYVEIAASVLFPAIFILTATRGLAVATLVVAALVTAFGTNFMGFGQYMVCFVAGAAIARHGAGLGRRLVEAPAPVRLSILALAWAVLLGAERLYAPTVHMHPHVVLAVGAAATIIVAHVYFGRSERLARSPTLLRLGEWSYGIYLLHFPVLFALAHAAAPFVVAPSPAEALAANIGLAIATLAVVIPTAALVHALVERPTIRLGRALAPWIARPFAAVSAGFMRLRAAGGVR